MSGVQMALLAGSGGPGGAAQGFSAVLRNTSASSGLRSVTFSLVSDGTSTTGASPAGGSQSIGNWFAPAPTTGAGTSFWCKFTTGSSSNTNISGSAVGSVLAMSGTDSWTFQNTLTTTEGTGSASVSIYSDAGGTNLVATGTVSWDVGFAP